MKTEVTAETIAELRRLLAEATPGPWDYVASDEHHGPYVAGLGDICDCYTMSNPSALSVRNGGDSKPVHFQHEQADPNAQLIAAAVNALPALLDQIDTQAAEIDRLHKQSTEYWSRWRTDHALLDEAAKGLTQAASDVLAERRRQIDVEGWALEHDDKEHDLEQLADAAVCYIKPTLVHTHWPWAIEWWKPKKRRRNLVRACALILAEIERLDRLARLRTAIPADEPQGDVK